MTDPVDEAIAAALCSNWARAIEINSQILKDDSNNIDCLNRLGKAYLELGENKKSATIFRRVLKIDKYDPIAQKNLARCLQAPVYKKTCCSQPTPIPIINFLEEPGRTKLISLVNLAPFQTLLKQKQADRLVLVPKRHTVVATDSEDSYLGSLPDDIGRRLSILIKGGNRYCALIKSVSKSSLIIFVREISRAKRFTDTPSFIANNNDYFSFVRNEGLSDNATADTETEGEDDAPSGTKLHEDEEPEA